MVMGRRQRALIQVQSLTQSKDASGGVQEVWTDFVTRWAEPRPMGGREYYAAQQVASTDRMGFKLRYDEQTALINTKHRILYGTRDFDIESITNVDEQNRDLILICTERH